MHPFAEVRDGVEDGLGIVEAIGNQDDEPATGKLAGERVQGLACVGDLPRLVRGEALAEEPQMSCAVARGNEVAHLVVVDGEAERVLLLAGDVAERGGDAAGVLILRRQAGGAVRHGAGAVEDHMHAQAGLLLILPDVVALRAAEDLPVEVAQIVALHVFAPVGKLHARALERAAMAAGLRALDDVARADGELLELAHRFGGEEVADAGHVRTRR